MEITGISGFNPMLQISASSLEKFCKLARDLMLTYITEIGVEVLLNAKDLIEDTWTYCASTLLK